MLFLSSLVQRSLNFKKKMHETLPKMNLKKIGLIAGLGMTGLIVIKYKHQSSSLPAQTVSVIKIAPTNLSKTITLTAEIQPFTVAILYAKVAGYLKEIKVDIGDQVKKGDILSVIDTPELSDKLRKNKAHYEIAKLNYDRIHGVYKKRPQLVAQENLDQAHASYKVAKSTYELSQTMYAYSLIIAPYDGIITKRFVDQGAMIQLGTHSTTQAMPIVEIADHKKFRLIFPVPESIASQVEVGNAVEIKIPALNQVIQSKIARIARKVTRETRTMETQVDVESSDLSLIPGLYAYVTLYLDVKKNVLAVPVQTVALGNESTLLIVNKKGELEQRVVKIGLKTPNMIEITSGVQEGEQVVFGDQSNLLPGTKVIPKELEPSQISYDLNK